VAFSVAARARAVFGFGLLVGLVALLDASPASAQRMDLALARLSTTTGAGTFVPDDASWRQLITEFTGALIPPTLTPARTRGPRSFYFGLDTSLTGISSSTNFWHRGTEGQENGASENRQVDGVLAWTRLTVRKAFPFGFELGTNIGYLVNTSYWALGLEIRWSLLEGWLSHDWVVPDIALRGAVQTMVGDLEFNATVIAMDLTISNSIIIGDAFELTPITGGQAVYTIADSELVDFTPGRNAFAQCNPDPATPTNPGDPQCRPATAGGDYSNNGVFAQIRTWRPRAFVGLQGRYEAFTLTGMFSGDVIPVTDIHSNGLVDAMGNPLSIARQWRVDIAAGLSY
jgi:hypothetical protein